jgi:hypothetical protein
VGKGRLAGRYVLLGGARKPIDKPLIY